MISQYFVESIIVNEEAVYLQEGLGTMFRKIGEWLTDYYPNDKKINTLVDMYQKNLNRCHRMHTTTDTQIDTVDDLGVPIITKSTYTQDPEYA